MKKINSVYDTIYRKLEKLGLIKEGKLTFEEYLKLKSGGFMDLNIDVLEVTHDSIKISLAHNYEQNGDLVPDPDMEIRIYPDSKMAEALTFQDSRSYTMVYPEPNKINPKAKKELNHFLNFWLGNLIKQGFKNNYL
jgi:uncharacterized protein YqiB (DUF1249 family)